MLKHQIFIPNGQQFDRYISPAKRQLGLSWYVVPIGHWWILANGEFGVLHVFQAESLTSSVLEGVVNQTLDRYSPGDSNFMRSIEVSWRSASWHASTGLPDHLQERFRLAVEIHSQSMCFTEAAALLNQKPLKISSVTMSPEDGLRGLLQELQSRYLNYVSNSSLIGLLWDSLWRRTPWLDECVNQRAYLQKNPSPWICTEFLFSVVVIQ